MGVNRSQTAALIRKRMIIRMVIGAHLRQAIRLHLIMVRTEGIHNRGSTQLQSIKMDKISALWMLGASECKVNCLLKSENRILFSVHSCLTFTGTQGFRRRRRQLRSRRDTPAMRIDKDDKKKTRRRRSPAGEDVKTESRFGGFDWPQNPYQSGQQNANSQGFAQNQNPFGNQQSGANTVSIDSRG